MSRRRLIPLAGTNWGEQGSRTGYSARLSYLRVGIGDLAKLIQDLVQEGEVAGAQIVPPFREDLAGCRRGHLGCPPATFLDHDQPGATIRWVGRPADIAQVFQLIDQHPSALLTHLRLVSQVCETRTARGDALEHAGLSQGPVVEPGILDGPENPVLHVSVRDEQRPP